MTVRRLQPAWRFSRNELSGKPGAVHAARMRQVRVFRQRPDPPQANAHAVDVLLRHQDVTSLTRSRRPHTGIHVQHEV